MDKPAAQMTQIDVDLVRRQPTLTSALILCQTLGGVEDKELCGKQGIVSDPATWSRIKSGSNNFPQDRLLEFMEVCRNEVPLIWLADRRGYELVRLETALEAELRLSREDRVKLEAENKLLRGLLTGKVGELVRGSGGT